MLLSVTPPHFANTPGAGCGGASPGHPTPRGSACERRVKKFGVCASPDRSSSVCDTGTSSDTPSCAVLKIGLRVPQAQNSLGIAETCLIKLFIKVPCETKQFPYLRVLGGPPGRPRGNFTQKPLFLYSPKPVGGRFTLIRPRIT